MIERNVERGAKSASGVARSPGRVGSVQVRGAADNLTSVVSRPGLDLAALKNKAEADPNGFVEVMADLVERRAAHDFAVKSGDRPTDNEAAKFSFADMRNVRGLREALEDVKIQVSDPNDRTRAATVQTSAFAVATNSLVVAGVNEAFLDVEPIEDQLVRHMPTNKKLSAFVGVLTDSTAGDAKNAAQEGDDFKMLSATEEEYWIKHLRQGLQITLSQELFEENDVPGITSRITDLGFLARRLRRQQVLKRITDHDGSAASGAEPYALHGPGAPTGRALFQTTAAAPLTRLGSSGNRLTNNALVDVTDIENARAQLATMLHSDGFRIAIPQSEIVMLVPDALLYTAWQITTSSMEPGVFNAMNFFGPNGIRKPGLVSSPFMDDLSTSAWYYGAPRLQFTFAEKLAPEVATYGGPNTEAFVSSRQALRVRIAWDFEVGCTDYVYWLQNLSGSTAPKDE